MYKQVEPTSLSQRTPTIHYYRIRTHKAAARQGRPFKIISFELMADN